MTISKIRFLESQGLVNPERTPSGYRKFYEHDVERLRWVLRQQREHFLPLKVIKDRLDEDANGATPAPAKASRTAAASGAGESKSNGPDVAASTAVTPEPSEQEPVLVGQRTSSVRRGAEIESAEAPAPTEPTSALPGIETSPRTTTTTTATSSSPPEPAHPVERAHRANLAAPPPHPVDHTVANGSGNGAGSRGTPSTPDDAATGKPAARTSRSSAAAGATASSDVSEGGAGSTPEVVGESTDAMGGASLSLEELTTASGLNAEFVCQLQEFGLIRAAVVGGVEYFDEEALIVASVAAKFADFGIGARHLRLYRNTADREAGFIEQIVIPMVRQRNPEARARANQTADDLARLGQQLRGSLLRTALRDLLNG